MKVVYFGTPLFAAKLLKVLLDSGINIVGIITKPDKAHGRSQKLQPTAVKEIAQAYAPHLPLYQPEIVSSPEFAPQLQALEADLFVVVAYGEIIKQHLLDMPRYGCINVHASILPKYRGAAPIQQAIIHGEKESGVTIMQMVRKMDAGDIIRVEKVPIEQNTTYGELEQQLCQASVEPLLEVLKSYQNGIIPAHFPQDPSLVTFAPKIELEDCQIDWQKPGFELHNLVRGVNPEPGAWCYVMVKGEKKRLKVFRSEYVEIGNAKPGTVLEYGKKGVVIACGSHALRIIELQLEGKRRMNPIEFTSGIAAENFSCLIQAEEN